MVTPQTSLLLIELFIVTKRRRESDPVAFLSSGVLPPHLCEPPPPCGAACPGGAAAQRQAGAGVVRHGSRPARQDRGAAAHRHQPEPKHQQRHLPLPGAEASERGHAQSDTPSYLLQPPDLQGTSACVSSAIQARPQRQWRRQQAHLLVWALFSYRGPP